MGTQKTNEEIALLREGGARHASILDVLSEMVAPGISTQVLEDRARELIAECEGDTASFLGYRPEGAPRPFPAALCVSINEEIVHGIPNEDPTILQEGDIVKIDLGLTHAGLVTDSARTVIVGQGDERAREFVAATRRALEAGIAAARAGNHIGDIGYAVESVVRATPFVIIEELVGHGVGYSVHEEPLVPNVGQPGTGMKILPRMVLAIEAMLAEEGDGRLSLGADGYTYSTADGARSTQIEHTIAITENGAPEILTLSKK